MNDDLLKSTLEPLKRMGLTVERKRRAVKPKGQTGLHSYGHVQIAKKGSQHVDYVVEAKPTLTPATLGGVVAQARELESATGCPALIVTARVTEPIAEKLREMGVQFADAAGNANLVGPNFLVYVSGRKPPKQPTAHRISRTFGTAGIKVLFALLCDPNLAGATYREIAAAAGVALGGMPQILADLMADGHLSVIGQNRRFEPTRRLLDEWAQAYARTLRPKTLLDTYVTPKFATWKDWTLEPAKVRWGGEPAANRLVGYLQPGVLTLYADGPPARLIVEQRLARIHTPDREYTVELRRPFWGPALDARTAPDTVPPVLVYADLLATGDARCIETAEKLYAKHLARLFQDH